MAEFPPPMEPEEARRFVRKRRGRSVAILLALVATAILFYAIAMVKLAAVGHGVGHGAG